MTIAGGIMGALFHRERTGEAKVVDVSLLGTGIWAMGQAMGLSLLMDKPWRPPPIDAVSANPLSRMYKTRDERVIWFTCLQAAKYWPSMCEAIGRPELARDPRFADHESLFANGKEAAQILTDVFASATLAEWRERLAGFTGQWAVVQHTLEAAADPQSVANGYIQECKTAAGVPFQMATAPVQFDEEPAVPERAPEFNEHGDEILGELGLDMDAIVDLKVRGVVA
jgi:crotonobetainyl-CoA:carnitine CoA-transferase CaiB-like acyl-CoA transferase